MDVWLTWDGDGFPVCSSGFSPLHLLSCKDEPLHSRRWEFKWKQNWKRRIQIIHLTLLVRFQPKQGVFSLMFSFPSTFSLSLLSWGCWLRQQISLWSSAQLAYAYGPIAISPVALGFGVHWNGLHNLNTSVLNIKLSFWRLGAPSPELTLMLLI